MTQDIHGGLRGLAPFLECGTPVPLLLQNNAKSGTGVPHSKKGASPLKPPLVTQHKVYKTALKTFGQLGLALAVDIGLMANFVYPLGALVLAGALGVGILITAKEGLRTSDPENKEWRYSLLGQGAGIALGILLHTAGPGYLLHELGHATASLILFKKAHPMIKVTPFLGGETTFNGKEGLTMLGSLLGYRRSVLIFTAAGVLATALAAMGLLELAEKLSERACWLKLVLTSWAITQVVSELLYGSAAMIISSDDYTNDFRRLWSAGGIHPLIPLGGMLSLLFIQKTLRGSAEQGLN